MTNDQSAPARTDRIIVLLPTYDERENLPMVLARIRAAVPTADVLVLDDNSPDGTGALADEMAQRDEHILVRHRSSKAGLGAAYLDGFIWALEQGYDVLVQIDADGSHPPEVLPTMIEALAEADLVIGSRWVPGGQVVNWPLHRKALSVGGNTYIRAMLGMSIKDSTAGFRAFRADALRACDLGSVESAGYCFQTDMSWRIVRAGLRVREVPITFTERQVGYSKMSGDIMLESLLRVTGWGARYRWEQLGRAFGRGKWHQL